MSMFRGMGLETMSRTPLKQEVPPLGKWKTNLRNCGCMYDYLVLKSAIYPQKNNCTLKHTQLTVIAEFGSFTQAEAF